jgi:dimethylargininase
VTRRIALTRPVPDSLGGCELTHLARTPIDVARARAQHAAYEDALREAGCEVRRLPPAHDQPDSVFIEDTAVVLGESAIGARPGAGSRRAEVAAVLDVLRTLCAVRTLDAPATLDGGDVLQLGRTLFVGVGGRTNAAGASQLAALASPAGCTVREVPAGPCLHLKSAVTAAAGDALLLNPDWIEPTLFDGYRIIEVHPSEPYAANVLLLGGTVLCAAAHVRTNAALAAAGFMLRRVDVSELAKAEGAVTCCSLLC